MDHSCYSKLLKITLNTSPWLASKIALKTWYTIPQRKQSRIEEKLIESAEQSRIAFGKRVLASYRFPGEQKRLLLIHGWGGTSSGFGFVMNCLKKSGFEVIAFDAPGHGLSCGNSSNFYEFTEAIRIVASEHGPFDGTLAHSAGSLCALAQKEETALGRLVCINPPASLQDLLFGHFSRQHSLSEQLANQVKTMIEKRFSSQIWSDFHGETCLQQTNKPTLIVYDNDDDIAEPDKWKQLDERSPHVRLLATTGLGHYGSLLNREVVNAAIEFINDTTLPS